MLDRLLGKIKMFRILQFLPNKPPDVIDPRGTPHPPYGHLLHSMAHFVPTPSKGKVLGRPARCHSGRVTGDDGASSAAGASPRPTHS